MNAANVGLGAGPLGDPALDEREVERLVHAALDLGIRVIDTAPSYGPSEERVGRALAAPGARQRVTLVTKGGYGVPGVPDWSPEVITHGIDAALTRMRTDFLDVFLLHSCARARLARGDLIAPLEEAQRAGKIRAFGYSGDGDALDWAARFAGFGVVECSVNVVDIAALAHAVPTAAARGARVFAKRAFASAAFGSGGGREGHDGTYPQRFRAAFADVPDADERLGGLGWDEVAVRFAAHAPGVSTALFGTKSPAHLAAIARFAAKGPLPAAILEELRHRVIGHGWPGVV